VKTESGARLPASFRSGRFDEWKAKKRIHLPKIGDLEGDAAKVPGSSGMRKFRHNQSTDAKPLDSKSTTYEKKLYIAKKKAEKLAQNGDSGSQPESQGRQAARSELRSVNDIRKVRKVQEQVCRYSYRQRWHGTELCLSSQRRAKNARPSKKGAKGRSRR
jgi:ATP-dependent RNA helicase DDX54/DBP10